MFLLTTSRGRQSPAACECERAVSVCAEQFWRVMKALHCCSTDEMMGVATVLEGLPH